MDEKMRAEFEAWWREENGNRLYCESAWRGWQASRAALVVKLPQGSEPGDFAHPVMVAEVEAVISAIESAGVRVKP